MLFFKRIIRFLKEYKSLSGRIHFELFTFSSLWTYNEKNAHTNNIHTHNDTWLTKTWTAIDRLSVIWKSDLTDKMKLSFFQAAIVSILLYGCTTWTLTKQLEKKLNSNYTRMLQATLNRSWRQHHQSSSCTATYHPSRKLSKLDEPDMQDTAGEVGTSSFVFAPMDPYTWSSKSRATSSNLLAAALWGYGV